MPTAIAIGSYGERVAAAFLRRHGYRILLRNFLTPEGEIDLICRCADVLVFVEVKTRSSVHYGRPFESIDKRKLHALQAAAERYLRMLKNRNVYYRFDAVEVMLEAGKIPTCHLVTDI